MAKTTKSSGDAETSASAHRPWTSYILPVGLRAALALGAIGLATFALLWNTMFAQLPKLPADEALWEMDREPAIEFLDASGQTIAVRGPRYGRATSLAELPPHVVNAFIAVEDKRFLAHDGVDYSAIFRAMLENIRAGHTVQGGSTITQQLVKNLVLTSDQTIRRKAQEARLAMELEERLTKDEILELYLNTTYFGASAYGIDAAALAFFDTRPRDLSIAQAAFLAAVPKAPSRFARPEASAALKQRQLYVLDQMVEAGFITASQADAAASTDLVFAKPEDVKAREAEEAAEDPDNPRIDVEFKGHVLDYAAQQVSAMLDNPPPDLIVQLTLDLDLQEAAETALKNRLDKLGESRGASEAAAILMDRTGAIRAMVGGRDYEASQFNRAVQARRQPGSAFKMFVYAAALEHGLQPRTIRYDEPIRIGDWRPRNYGGVYRGAVTLAEALAESLNTVAATVGVEIGLENVTDLARRFGITTQLQNYPSVTLGSDEVTLIDLTSAYGVLALGGKQMSPSIIQEIRNSRGEVLFSRPEIDQPRIYDEDLARQMTGMLTRVVVQGTGRAAQIEGWDVAGKTGTSQDWRDAWFVGYTSDFVAGVWVGNDDDTPMNKVTGGELPTLIWHDMMAAAVEGREPGKLDGAESLDIFLTNTDMERLNFYRRLSSAFRSLEGEDATPIRAGGNL